jgi:hypothetical protein
MNRGPCIWLQCWQIPVLLFCSKSISNITKCRGFCIRFNTIVLETRSIHRYISSGLTLHQLPCLSSTAIILQFQAIDMPYFMILSMSTFPSKKSIS